MKKGTIRSTVSFFFSLIALVVGLGFMGCYNPLQSRPNPSSTTTNVKTFPVSVTWNGGGSAVARGLIDDPAVASVSILVYNSKTALIGSGTLVKKQTCWGGKINVSETGLATFEARAKNSSGVELYYGGAQPTLTGDGNDIVAIGVSIVPPYPSDLGLYGADVSSLCSLGSTIFAGTSGGVFRSADNGSSWAKVETTSSVFPNGSINAVTDMAVDGSKVFAITDISGGVDPFIISGPEDGNGWTIGSYSNWSEPLYSATWFTCIAGQGNWLYMGSTGACYFSSDEGVTWIDYWGFSGDIDDLVIQGTKVFAACEGGIFVSTLGSTSWTQCTTAQTSVTRLGCDGTTLAAGSLENNITKVYKSLDSGVTWQDTGFPVDYQEFITSLAVQAGAIIATTDDTGGGGIWRYSGSSWAQIYNGFAKCRVNTVLAKGTTLYAGTSNGVLVSTDSGATWNDRIQGLRATYVSGMAVEGSTVLAADDHESDYTRGLFYSTNSGSSWATLNAPFLDLWSGADPLAVHNGSFYVRTFGGTVKFTEDQGGNWITAGSAPGSINALVFRGTDLYAASNKGIFKSTDGGISWSANKLPSTMPVLSFCDDGTRLVASTPSGLYISTDGAVWDQNLIWIGALCLTPTSTGLCAICSNKWVFTADFRGTTTGGTVAWNVWSVVSYGSKLFVATGDQGLNCSSDNGATWTKVSGLPTDLVWSLSVVLQGLLVGTRDGGLWVIPGPQ